MGSSEYNDFFFNSLSSSFSFCSVVSSFFGFRAGFLATIFLTTFFFLGLGAAFLGAAFLEFALGLAVAFFLIVVVLAVVVVPASVANDLRAQDLVKLEASHPRLLFSIAVRETNRETTDGTVTGRKVNRRTAVRPTEESMMLNECVYVVDQLVVLILSPGSGR